MHAARPVRTGSLIVGTALAAALLGASVSAACPPEEAKQRVRVQKSAGGEPVTIRVEKSSDARPAWIEKVEVSGDEKDATSYEAWQKLKDGGGHEAEAHTGEIEIQVIINGVVRSLHEAMKGVKLKLHGLHKGGIQGEDALIEITDDADPHEMILRHLGGAGKGEKRLQWIVEDEEDGDDEEILHWVSEIAPGVEGHAVIVIEKDGNGLRFRAGQGDAPLPQIERRRIERRAAPRPRIQRRAEVRRQVERRATSRPQALRRTDRRATMPPQARPRIERFALPAQPRARADRNLTRRPPEAPPASAEARLEARIEHLEAQIGKLRTMLEKAEAGRNTQKSKEKKGKRRAGGGRLR